MSVHIRYSEGSAEFTGCFKSDKPQAIMRCDSISQKPYLVLDLPDDGARGDGIRLELDGDLADGVAKALRRAITEYRKRGGGGER